MELFHKLCKSNIYTNCIQFLKVIFHLHYDRMAAVFLVLHKTSASLFYTQVCAAAGPKAKEDKETRGNARVDGGARLGGQESLSGWR